ncbi:MAG: S-layer homology domain-containing protein [Tumebacillaceae bacterium]
MLKVIVPLGLDVEPAEGQEWNALTRTLSWKFHEVEKDEVRAVHFQLKVKGELAVGSTFDVSCELDEDGQVKFQTPKVSVRKGTHVDQPFFVGYPDGKFHPEDAITRAEAAAVVARVKNLTDGSQKHEYADVESGHWAFSYINKVTNAGYMVGDSNGNFRPNQPITRAELVRLVLSVRGVQPWPFAGYDDTKGHWAQGAIGTAKELKFIDGVGEGKFLPNASTERQAAAKLFDVALFRGPLKDGAVPVVQHFPDVTPKDWSFGWVEEAVVVAHEAEHKGVGIERLIRYLPNQTKQM